MMKVIERNLDHWFRESELIDRVEQNLLNSKSRSIRKLGNRLWWRRRR